MTNFSSVARLFSGKVFCINSADFVSHIHQATELAELLLPTAATLVVWNESAALDLVESYALVPLKGWSEPPGLTDEIRSTIFNLNYVVGM